MLIILTVGLCSFILYRIFIYKPMIYVACSMTGQDRVKVLDRANHITKLFTDAGFRVFHPALEEGIPYTSGVLEVDQSLRDKWKLDKWAIRRSICLVDSSADLKSEGREHEVGLMRYSYWRPVVRISPRHATGFFSIAVMEDDTIVGTDEEAVAKVKELYGIWWKRAWFWLKIRGRCLPRAILEQARGFWL